MSGREAFAGRQRTHGRVFLSASACFESPAVLALDRVVRSGQPASVLRLYLSRLPATILQPYHGRVARCLFDDAVQRGGGQVFAYNNGDLALIAGPEAAGSLGAVLLRLFRAEAASNRHLIGLWSLPDEEALARREFAAAADVPMITQNSPATLGTTAVISSLLASDRTEDFVRRQTAVRIDRGGMTALFQELSVSLPAIEAQVGAPVHRADPHLLRYIAGQLHGRLLPRLAQTPLFQTAARETPSLTVNLPLDAIATPPFEAVRVAARDAGTLLGVEIAFVDAIAQPASFTEARQRLQNEGCTVLVDAVDHHALLLCDPAALRPDILKLEWSPLLPGLPAREQRLLRQALSAVGLDRVVLHRAETEAALVWGRSQGIACYQGRHVDLMLAANRLRTCGHSAACSMGQCVSRAEAPDKTGQHGCEDLAMLRGKRHLPPGLADGGNA